MGVINKNNGITARLIDGGTPAVSAGVWPGQQAP